MKMKDDTVVQALKVTIAAVNTTKDLVPIDLAKGILGTIANILNIVQSVIENKSDFQVIINMCDAIRGVLEEATEGATEDDLRGSVGKALSKLNVSVNHVNSEIASRKEGNFLHRVFSVTIDRDKIAGWEKDLDRALMLFNTGAIAGIGIGIKKLALGLEGNINRINFLKYRPTVPPSRPSMFYGRDALVAELTDLVINDEHIALIGPGGMGKSSLSKAILNEPLITEKFSDRRFFVTYDGLDPATITFEAFVTRFATALGTELAGSDPVRQLSTFLRSARALVVLDNAETFEEASGSSALEKIPPAIADIADIPGVILILTSRSRRNSPQRSMDNEGSSRSDAEEEIKDLLKELEFHPLSINLLANAAQQNNWSPHMLLKRWNHLHSKVLEHGRGKLQSLSFTMQLSLSSPSIRDLGEDGRRTLAIIAFLPQGLNADLASVLLPSLPQVDAICDVLCIQSLVYRQNNFIKMLAPIRHYVQDSALSPIDTTSLRDICDFYDHTVEEWSEEQDHHHADIIISDHLNIEHIVAFNLARVSDATNQIYDVCWQFLWCLLCHLPRPTTLSTAIFDIVENPSTRTLKAHCLYYLGALYGALCQVGEKQKALRAAETLYIAASVHEGVAWCVTGRANLYTCQGRFIEAKKVLEDLQGSDSWDYLNEGEKAHVWYLLGRAQMHTLAAPVDELFVKSMEDRDWGLRSHIAHWVAKFYSERDIVPVKMHLEDLLQRGDMYDRQSALHVLAEVAFCEDRLSEAMDILQSIIEMKGQFLSSVDWYTVFKGVVASQQGNYDLARELIHKTSRPSEFALHSTDIFLHRSYASARVELTAEEYDRAESYFTATVEGCDVQSELMFKAFSVRGLGEIAFARGNFALAEQRFAEAQFLCTDMGVSPRRLYSCFPISALPERFEGWLLFLDGRSPFEKAM
ncbi:hypothetical protein K503DRAFT_858020 [Rhizopogon vinicolor AM-OR11-026]|uniref:Novel STAND NTPase 1 domain-containing protein n=1 Tax=Rhizopogon vinicolor AM-OR11-026 TaxID=1314800 RepID=A0A1B7MUZ1_9AGAM|nr:hypothetical protein K503DRAFT_858020 [Rhizopogon vinicolor AM-OR11-026]